MKYVVEVAEVWKRTFEVEISDETAQQALVGGESLATRARNVVSGKIENGEEDQGFEFSDYQDQEKG